jgi:hypothetical protein
MDTRLQLALAESGIVWYDWSLFGKNPAAINNFLNCPFDIFLYEKFLALRRQQRLVCRKLLKNCNFK